MTQRELEDHLSTYAAGLEAELALLRHVQYLSTTQHEAGKSHDIDRLNQIADDRARLMSGLVKIESEIRASRHALAENQRLACQLSGFDDVVVLHRAAATLVAKIIAADQGTMEALRTAEAARREASQAIEAGESTLAAYRRVISPSPTGPALVDRRG